MKAHPAGRRVKWHRRSDDGAAAVEFALVVPLLVMLVSGIMGFGIVFAQQISLGNAARQAARAAAVNGPTCGTGQASGSAGTNLTGAAKTDATTIWVTRNDVAVTIKRANATPSSWSSGTCSGDTAKVCDGSAAGDNVYVRMQYTSTLNFPFFSPSFDLDTVGAFRCEFQ